MPDRELYVIVLDISNAAPDYLERLLPFVSKQRQERVAKFRNHNDKLRCLFGELLLRYIAAKAIGEPTTQIELAANENGKPYLPAYPNKHITLSHSGFYLAAAIADKPIGIDIEKMETGKELINRKIAYRFFANSEIKEVKREPKMFYAIWTQKEAYLKMKGTGLCAKLNTVEPSADLSCATFSSNQLPNYTLSVTIEI